jgi:prepilin-type N-terminal cleavage/methylation domain-containing protein
MSAMLGRRRGDQAGVTLIEVLISMIVLAIVTTMLMQGWISLQRATATVERTNDARATGRDALSRLSSELRASQPTALPDPSGTAIPASDPPILDASPYSVIFYSAYNSSAANADGSGIGAVRRTRLWLDTVNAQAAPWNPQCKTLYWQRDMNGNGVFTDTVDRTMPLAFNIANEDVADSINGTAYTPVFRYAYLDGGDISWTDDANSVLSSIVGVSVRLVVNAKMGGTPKYVDVMTTVRLRNASVD